MFTQLRCKDLGVVAKTQFLCSFEHKLDTFNFPIFLRRPPCLLSVTGSYLKPRLRICSLGLTKRNRTLSREERKPWLKWIPGKSGVNQGIKGTVSVISSDPQCKDNNARFTTVSLNRGKSLILTISPFFPYIIYFLSTKGIY